jgi:hypothetical protein
MLRRGIVYSENCVAALADLSHLQAVIVAVLCLSNTSE